MLEFSRSNDTSATIDLRHYRGPERRGHGWSLRTEDLLASTLDEIDYGVFLLDEDLRAVHVNHAGRAELDDDSHPLQLLGAMLCARRQQDKPRLLDALCAAAARGLRKQLTLGADARRVTLSIVPLLTAQPFSKPAVLVMLGRRCVFDTLSIQSFAAGHRLTGAESHVFTELCRGTSPAEIALQTHVAISTVRSQIGSIRLKTGARSIRMLLQQVAALPPMLSILRAPSGAPPSQAPLRRQQAGAAGAPPVAYGRAAASSLSGREPECPDQTSSSTLSPCFRSACGASLSGAN